MKESTNGMNTHPTAAILIIGNEILSGRTQDVNVQYIAERLTKIGIRLNHVAVVPDVEEMIVDTVKWMQRTFTYVFTTGGIGPTHDDITAAAMAKAFDTELERNPTAYKILLDYYGLENLTPAREKMAFIPKGAALIQNDVTLAPGFKMDNVHVLAGVPKIMQDMFNHVLNSLDRGQPFQSGAIHTYLPESLIAPGLEEIQRQFPHLDMGSYPFYHPEKGHGVSLVVKGTEKEDIDQSVLDLEGLILKLGGVPIHDDKFERPSGNPWPDNVS